jgi:hypothetical protein
MDAMAFALDACKEVNMPKIFSIPFNPFITEKYFEEIFLPFLKTHKEWIYDIYFTSRIEPFAQDAMGADIREEDRDTLIQNALFIQESLGIQISATFNNINVSPKFENYRLFKKNFKDLYDAGIQSATIPHAHWVALGLKKEFPNLKIKNTILRKVATAQDYVLAAEQGFDYINIDRILMRDLDALKEIKRAQSYIKQKIGKHIPIALLTNEGCFGRCPMMDEHYSYNNLKTPNDLPYFKHEISKVTCEYKWEKEINAFFFKAATIPPFKEEYEELLQYVDVFKMHGRDSFNRLNETISIIKNYALGQEILQDNSQAYLDGVSYEELKSWRRKIKTCKFQCWDCNYCDIIAEKKKNARPN